MRPGAGVEEGLHLLPAEYQGTYFSWNQATVPGDVYTDLQRAGELDDLYFGRNMGRAKWAQECEWWYSHRFNLPESMQGKQIHVEFDGVDFGCDVYLNSHFLGHHEGMFSGFAFDVTRYVHGSDWRGGSNILMVKLDPPPKNLRNVGGRKWFFSGDYMTGLVPMGIWQPVRVVATDVVKIENLRIESDLRDNGDSGATVGVEVEMSCSLESPEDAMVSAVVKGKNFDSSVYKTSATGIVRHGKDNRIQLSFDIPDAKLWWPWDMGDQNLYEVSVSVERGGTAQDSVVETFGIREIRMERNPTMTEEDAEYPWTFMINGKRHYLRSGCWGGPPSFLYGRNTLKKYEDRLKLVKEANINNLRIFGWHPPEIPDFYRICDELGITVWTNFCFATQAYSAEPKYLDPALHECAEIVKDRRNHPSAIFWMGGEEVFFSGAHVVGDNKLIMEKVGEAVAEVTNVPYGIASPLSEHYGTSLGYKPKESVHANGHYYGAGELMMEEFYANLDFCVVPELTAASAPNVESLKKFIPENELWPMGPSWGYHAADIDILRNLNVEVFGDERMDSLESFVESTQIAQGMIFQYAVEHFRRRKPRVSAVAICHFMTNWPDIKWGIIDYYGEKKLSFDYMKRAYQPLVSSLEYEKRRWSPGEDLKADVWIVNDYHRSFESVTLDWWITKGDGKRLAEGRKSVDITPDSSASITPVEWNVEGEPERFFEVHMKLSDGDGNLLSQNFHSLLVGDQQAAKKLVQENYERNTQHGEQYGLSYYRYHPELWEFD